MLKKTITYTDYNGEQRSEDFYFNLNKAELVEMEMSAQGGLKYIIEKISQEKDNAKLFAFFKDVIHRSYGIKSADGKRFIKNDEAWAAFEQSEAYSELIMEFLSDDSATVVTAFLEGVFPADLVDAAKKENGGSVIPAANHPLAG